MNKWQGLGLVLLIVSAVGKIISHNPSLLILFIAIGIIGVILLTWQPGKDEEGE